MAIPTEPIGSIPRPLQLIEAGRDLAAGQITPEEYARLADAAVRETVEQFEATGSPLITDGEQGKPSFATYPLAGLQALAPDGVVIGFADGHIRQLPRLTTGPFSYAARLEAAEYLPPAQLGTCDDCGFAPFGDDTFTTRETAFAKIRACVAGTQLAAAELGL
jgi:5-methyltetrahydropteroyltriglutamate--homocysteine methyltransferase